MEVVVRCPASCGELLQGMMNGKEMLVSYPVNLYSTVKIGIHQNKTHHRIQMYPKVYNVLQYFLKYIGEKSLQLEQIEVQVNSNIPIGKGMASSTADIAAAVYALAELMQYPITEEVLARTALSVEPTDSTLFRNLTLLDHLNGTYIETLGSMPKCNVLVLEGQGVIETVSFRNDKEYLSRVKNRDAALKILKKGIETKDLRLIGQAATESSLLNQDLLNKPYLENLIEITKQYNALGVSVAHSGTVCGVLYDDSTDIEKLKKTVQHKLSPTYFNKMYNLHTVNGGPERIS